MSDVGILSISSPSWFERASCAQCDPELFFPPAGHPGQVASQVAKSVCKECPVRLECLDFALRQPNLYGVWGGTCEHERKAIRRAAR